MKLGYCYFGTLQIIHRMGMKGDILPRVFEMAGLDSSQVRTEEVVYVVHGFVHNADGKIIEHSWIEFLGHVYDFTIGELGETFMLLEFQEAYKPNNIKRFTRDQVFQILQHDRSVIFWGHITQENLKFIYETIQPSTYSEVSREFLQEYDDIPDSAPQS
jgi:hypothetical protein